MMLGNELKAMTLLGSLSAAVALPAQAVEPVETVDFGGYDASSGSVNEWLEGRGFVFERAAKDPKHANLDRVQVVKGWLDAEGAPQEKVYDVALSDDRSAGADGKVPPVGNTVDLTTGHWTNDIGDPELAAAWSDPEFDPSLRAFYYVRVIQIPTPRDTLYDAIALGMKVEETGRPATIQERAYSSPIWYTP